MPGLSLAPHDFRARWHERRSRKPLEEGDKLAQGRSIEGEAAQAVAHIGIKVRIGQFSAVKDKEVDVPASRPSSLFAPQVVNPRECRCPAPGCRGSRDNAAGDGSACTSASIAIWQDQDTRPINGLYGDPGFRQFPNAGAIQLNKCALILLPRLRGICLPQFDGSHERSQFIQLDICPLAAPTCLTVLTRDRWVPLECLAEEALQGRRSGGSAKGDGETLQVALNRGESTTLMGIGDACLGRNNGDEAHLLTTIRIQKYVVRCWHILAHTVYSLSMKADASRILSPT